MNHYLRNVLIILLILPLFAGCKEKSNIPSSREQFWVPSPPPKSRYIIDARVDAAKAAIEGQEKIILKNTSKLPIYVIALDWQISDLSSLEVIAHGQKLSPLGGPSGAIGSPVFFDLLKAVAPGEKLELNINFKQEIEEPLEESLGGTHWYPRLWWDSLPLHDDFSVRLETPAGYALAASGRINPETGRYEAESTRTFGIYLGKGMKTQSREVEGVLITSLFTEKGSKAAAICLETAADAIKYYKDWLGFYPFSYLTIVPGDAGRWGGYPFATGIVAIHGLETYKEGESPQYWQHITSHEIGHEYWGEWVMEADDPGWLWISLGIFADTEYMIGRKYDPNRRANWMGNYIKAIPNYFDMTLDIPPALEEIIKYDRGNTVVHSKGPAVIFALDSVLGSEVFGRIYKKALSVFGGRCLGWRDFQELCESETGQNLEWFFNAWVRTNEHLCYTIESQDSQPEGQEFKTEIRVKRLGTMKMPVPVKAIFEDGTEQILQTDRTQDVNVLIFRSKAKLKEAIINPEKKLAMLEKPLPPISKEIAELLAYGWDSSDSLQVFEAVKDEVILSSNIWHLLGWELYENDHLKEASACFEKLAALETDADTKFAAQCWLGILSDLEGNRQEALAHYQEALNLWSGHAMSYERLNLDKAWVEDRVKTPFNLISVPALPANPTPEEMIEIVKHLSYTHEGKNPLLIYEKAKDLVITAQSFWFKLGLVLFDSGYYEESLRALEKIPMMGTSRTYIFAAWTWMGHLYDLLGKRKEAVDCYIKALDFDTGETIRSDQYGMKINRAWVESRLKSPFTWKKK
ncbi:MAG TPA: hypothetical protein PLP57_05365 [Candidatus Saccharicenans sp.]|nr:hypothetical protein [Candidatus Saccharicenans sp.]HRD02059.1 hypothetical protein [Candidatus Saccharicenans sp.]